MLNCCANGVTGRRDTMYDYEEAILARQEAEAIWDDCSDCPYAGVDTCKSQCMEEEEIWGFWLV